VQLGYLAGGWLTMGQLLSLPMLLLGVALLYLGGQWRQPSGNFSTAA
jgi:phosphatidylglycerol:prolipoprotein diacylglycerol transferase